METPYAINSYIKKEDHFYPLPTISYGIDGDTCYIYAIQYRNYPKELDSYQKKVKRQLYQLSKGVFDNETMEYQQFKQGESTYYPENISDVSPIAILSLSLFLYQLKRNNISKVNVVPFLPIRYEAKKQAILKKVAYYEEKRKWSHTQTKQYLTELENEQQQIQENLTEKLLRNFFRINYHFPNIKITSYPQDIDEYLHIEIDAFTLDSINSFNLQNNIDVLSNKER